MSRTHRRCIQSNRTYDTELIERLAALHLQGLTPSDITLEVSRPLNTVYNLMMEHLVEESGLKVPDACKVWDFSSDNVESVLRRFWLRVW